jgi:hypothetical protein
LAWKQQAHSRFITSEASIMKPSPVTAGATHVVLKMLGATALLGALSACANMAQTPPGTPLAEIQANYGAPNYRCTTETGMERVIWSQQPYGQYAWAANITPDGRAESVDLVLADPYFKRLAEGEWTPGRVRCTFGPPAQIETVGLPSVRETVWSYRYKQNGVWNSLMYVYFGHDGEKVTRFHPGPDPLFERNNFWFD